MSEELNIEIGEPIPNTFDYSLGPAELDKKLSERMAQVRRGEAAATHELTMLGYTLDLIDIAKNNMDITLDFNEESLPDYYKLLALLQDGFAQDPPTADEFNSYVKGATGFFGIMVIKNIGGNWATSNMGMTIIHNGQSAFVMNRIGRFLQGEKDDLSVFYNYLKMGKALSEG